jgi:hypothetical protein
MYTHAQNCGIKIVTHKYLTEFPSVLTRRSSKSGTIQLTSNLRTRRLLRTKERNSSHVHVPATISLHAYHTSIHLLFRSFPSSSIHRAESGITASSGVPQSHRYLFPDYTISIFIVIAVLTDLNCIFRSIIYPNLQHVQSILFRLNHNGTTAFITFSAAISARPFDRDHPRTSSPRLQLVPHTPALCLLEHSRRRTLALTRLLGHSCLPHIASLSPL